MKVLHAVAASSLLVLGTVGAHAASFTGQTIDGVLTSSVSPGVTTQFTSPIVAPGAFDGVMQDPFTQIWNVNVQVLSTEVIIDWTANDSEPNIKGPNDLLGVDLSGYTNGPVLELKSYSCTFPGVNCTSFGPGPSISRLTSTPTSFDVSFNVLRGGETLCSAPPCRSLRPGP